MRLSKCHDITPFASKDETRYNLTGVHLDPERSKVIATNGHYLAIVGVPKDPEGALRTETTLDPKTLSAALRALPRKGTTEQTSVAVVPESDGHVRLQNCQAAHLSPVIDGKFPDYEQVIPAKGDKVVRLNAEYLRTIADYATKHAYDRKSPWVDIYLPEDALSPVLFEADVGEMKERATLVLMPMRR